MLSELKGKENVVEDNKEVKRLAKQTVVHVFFGILHSNTKEWTVAASNNLDSSQGQYNKWSKPISKSHKLFNST